MAAFDAQTFLDSAGSARRIVDYRRGDVIFSQGDACNAVMYIKRGGVKLSVRSRVGVEAVVAMLGPGEFLGEGCLAGQRIRVASATALTPSTVLQVDKRRMLRVLREQHALSDRLIAHVLAAHARIEEDLIHQLFNSSERRLARALLLLVGYGRLDRPRRLLPKISRTALAEIAGTTRARVNFFLTKFKRRGFIAGRGRLSVNSSLLSVVLRD